MLTMATMHIPTENCPLAFSLHNFCHMSLIDHVNSWNLEYFLLPLFLTSLFVNLIILNFANLKIFFKRQRWRKFFNKLLNMYAIGILNTKLYGKLFLK